MRADGRHFVVPAVACLLALAGCGSDPGVTGQAIDSTPPTGTAEEALYAGQQAFVQVDNVGDLAHSYNTSHDYRTFSWTSSSTGVYAVTLFGLGGAGGNVQVSSMEGSTRCKVASWTGFNADEYIDVRCHDPSGAPRRASFVLQFQRATTSNGVGAYIWADQPTNGQYHPMGAYSWNSAYSATQNLVTRESRGVYDVYFPVVPQGGSARVTAYGTGAEYCKVADLMPTGQLQTLIVACFDGKGAPVDTKFSLNYSGPKAVSVYDEGAYVYANNATSASYTPDKSLSYNSGYITGTTGCAGYLGAITAGRISKGWYTMRYTNLSSTHEIALVSAYGYGPAYCSTAQPPFLNGVNTVEVDTFCYDPSGNRVDSRYLESYVTSDTRGPC